MTVETATYVIWVMCFVVGVVLQLDCIKDTLYEPEEN